MPAASGSSETPGKRLGGRKRAPRYTPNAQERRLVETLAGYGVPAEEIRRIVVNPVSGKALTAKALLRHFGEELARGLAQANANVAESLYRLAVGQAKVVVDGEVLQEEREPKVMAAVFWAKTRMGWSEARTSEEGVPRGAPILAEAKVTIYIPENNRDAGQAPRLRQGFGGAEARLRKARSREAVGETQDAVGAEGEQEDSNAEGKDES